MNGYKLLFEPITYPIEYKDDEVIKVVFKGDKIIENVLIVGKKMEK